MYEYIMVLIGHVYARRGRGRSRRGPRGRLRHGRHPHQQDGGRELRAGQFAQNNSFNIRILIHYNNIIHPKVLSWVIRELYKKFEKSEDEDNTEEEDKRKKLLQDVSDLREDGSVYRLVLDSQGESKMLNLVP